MKNLFLMLISVFLFSAASAQTTKTWYTCVMHPKVRQDKPGNCPKCGMTLIKKTVKVAVPKPAPKKEEESPKPSQPVQQPENKSMNMDKPVQAKPQAEPQKTKVVYTCVMHPEVQMDKPVDKPGNCPKCGMTLIKKAIKVPKQNTVPSKEDNKQMDMDMQEHNHTMAEMKTDSSNADGVVGSKVNVKAGKTVVYHFNKNIMWITHIFSYYPQTINFNRFSCVCPEAKFSRTDKRYNAVNEHEYDAA